MKKSFFFLSIVYCLLSTVVFSQQQNLNSAVIYYEDYSKYNEMKSLPLAKEKIDLAATNETTSGKFKTWHYRGMIYLALFDLNLKNIALSRQSDNTYRPIILDLKGRYDNKEFIPLSSYIGFLARKKRARRVQQLIERISRFQISR